MADRATEKREGKILSVPMAGSTDIDAGKMVALNSSGYAVPADDAAGLTVIGVSEESKSNAGGDGAASLLIRRLMAFKFTNSTSNAVSQAHVGKTVYVEDDETVASSTTNSIAAGKCLGVESDGIWVWIA